MCIRVSKSGQPGGHADRGSRGRSRNGHPAPEQHRSHRQGSERPGERRHVGICRGFHCNPFRRPEAAPCHRQRPRAGPAKAKGVPPQPPAPVAAVHESEAPSTCPPQAACRLPHTRPGTYVVSARLHMRIFAAVSCQSHFSMQCGSPALHIRRKARRGATPGHAASACRCCCWTS